MGLHLSPLEAGYLVHADAPAGERIVQALGLSDALLGAREHGQMEARRQAAQSALARSNQRFESRHSLFTTLAQRASADKWQDLFTSCVECGACSRVCPTCYCFYIYDTLSAETEPGALCRRCRAWDSCITADYSRMAGLPNAKPNPRPRLRTRFESRFRHKYQFHYETHRQYACVGCGRCSDVCVGRIDPREVMRVLDQ